MVRMERWKKLKQKIPPKKENGQSSFLHMFYRQLSFAWESQAFWTALSHGAQCWAEPGSPSRSQQQLCAYWDWSVDMIHPANIGTGSQKSPGDQTLVWGLGGQEQSPYPAAIRGLWGAQFPRFGWGWGGFPQCLLMVPLPPPALLLCQPWPPSPWCTRGAGGTAASCSGGAVGKAGDEEKQTDATFQPRWMAERLSCAMGSCAHGCPGTLPPVPGSCGCTIPLKWFFISAFISQVIFPRI